MENKVKQTYEKKYNLAKLVSEHLEEFEGMTIEEIMNCFIGNPQINKKPVYLPFYDGNEMNYGIYFKMISPKLDYCHEIVCAIEFREKEDHLQLGELPPVAGMSLLLSTQTKEENVNKSMSERCYGFYIYTNPSSHLRGKQNRYNLHIKVGNKDIFEKHACVGTEIYL